MTEYQAVMVKLAGRSREDEETFTDLLNERSRMGWSYLSATEVRGRLLVVFSRPA